MDLMEAMIPRPAHLLAKAIAMQAVIPRSLSSIFCPINVTCRLSKVLAYTSKGWLGLMRSRWCFQTQTGAHLEPEPYEGARFYSVSFGGNLIPVSLRHITTRYYVNKT
jgi:hypothetical protein